jgi:hypothetical protein
MEFINSIILFVSKYINVLFSDPLARPLSFVSHTVKFIVCMSNSCPEPDEYDIVLV